MERDAVSMTPEQVARLVDRGVGADDIVRLLVSTGTWSEAGAAEIVSTLAQRPTETARLDVSRPGMAGTVRGSSAAVCDLSNTTRRTWDGRGIRPHRP